MRISYKARQLAAKTSNAYSAKAYANWDAVAEMLLRKGYTEEYAEEIMRSKLARWAGDESKARYGRYTSSDLARYLAKHEEEQIAFDLNRPSAKVAQL